MNTKDTEWLGIGAAIAALLVAMTCTAAPRVQQWPKQIDTSDGQIMVYQPQVETFGGEAMTARAAVSVQTSFENEPLFGVVWFEAQTDTSRTAGTVNLLRTRATQVRFPDDAGDAEQLAATVAGAMSGWDVLMSLDEVLSSVAEAEAERGLQDALNNEAPAIIFSDRPALLVVLDGEPKTAKIEGTDVMRVVNTPYIMVFDASANTYYLKAGNYWMKTRDIYGTWDVASKVPTVAVAIAEGDGSSIARGMTSVTRPQDARDIGAIIVATEPTELVVIDGKPEYQTIAETNLLYVSNTDNDLFLDIDTQKMYLLIAGRWFTARQPEGPWIFTESDRLPATFAHIPPESAMGHVLASIAGTEQATDAVAVTYIPQTAAVRRSEATVTVIYDGMPRFEPIVGTRMLYAANSPYYVVLADDWYYCCDNAVWFVAQSPVGPWAVCDSVPRVIYTIPPSSPVYQVRYVRIYRSTPDVVYVGYLPGYTGCYVRRGCVVYGTGYRYHGWYSTVYYPRPVTWGFAFRYSNHSGWDIGIGINWGGCFGATRVEYVYGGWWGCGGFRVHDRHHPRRDRIIVVDRRDHRRAIDRGGPDTHHRRNINVYDRRKDVVVRRDDGRGRDARPGRIVPRDLASRGQNSGRPQDTQRRDDDRRESRQPGGRPASESSRTRDDRPDTRPGTGERTRENRTARDLTESPRLPIVTETRPAAGNKSDASSSHARGNERTRGTADRRTEAAGSPAAPAAQSPQETRETKASLPVTHSTRRESIRNRVTTTETTAQPRMPEVSAEPKQETREVAPSRRSSSSARRESIQSRVVTKEAPVRSQPPQVVAQPKETGETQASRPATPSTRRESVRSRASTEADRASAQDVKEQLERTTEERRGSRQARR